MRALVTSIRTNMVFVVVAVALGSMIAVGTLSYHYLEEWTWTESFYFTVCTLTTIGYGDLHPTSDASQIFTAIFALAGVGVAFGSFGALGAIYLKRGERILTKIAVLNDRQQ